MKLVDLSKPQWDAALEAARQLCSGNVHCADDRAAFRAAKARLVELLPEGADASDIITEATHWSAMNDIAAALAGIPNITITKRGAGSAQQAPAII